MNLESVLLSPLLTEKTQYLETIGERIGKRTTKYTFKVHIDANKHLVAQAIKKVYNLSPASIRIQVYRGKEKKFRQFAAPGPKWKKAIITFNNGETIDLGVGN